MPGSTNPIVRFFSALLKIFRFFRAVVLNLLFLFLVLIIVGGIIGQPALVVPQGAAIVVNPAGILVEQKSYISPVEQVIGGSTTPAGAGEVLLQDLLDAINLAAQDDRISSMVLLTDMFAGGGFGQLQEVGRALDAFKSSGKTIYAIGSAFSQSQYYLAARASEVILNSYGSVDLEGFSAWQNYFRDGLDKLGVNVHIFRVGAYKSAVEPFDRNDMSPEAKANYTELLTDLWRQYVNDVNTARNLAPGVIDNYINTQDQQLALFGGDSAQLALQTRLVDRTESRNTTIAYLRSRIGEQEDSYPNVDYVGYLQGQRKAAPALPGAPDTIGIIVASGTIVDGEAPRGAIGGDTLSGIIRNAREDDSIKGLVLRIDSGGGSAFASEIIRAELEAFKATGRPLVVSMGSVAASGGYWIATPANQIWASASTITGSIGIFGIYPTFENSLAKLGVYTDGVGTTELAGYATIGRNLPPLAERSLQLTVENGYARFISLVAQSRNMTEAAVDRVAQGQVWSGENALEQGLVDNLGSFEEAIAAAAQLAGLDSWSTRLLEIQMSPSEVLLQQLIDNTGAQALLAPLVRSVQQSPVEVLLRRVEREFRHLLNLNDPDALYLQCLECNGLTL